MSDTNDVFVDMGPEIQSGNRFMDSRRKEKNAAAHYKSFTAFCLPKSKVKLSPITK